MKRCAGLCLILGVSFAPIVFADDAAEEADPALFAEDEKPEEADADAPAQGDEAEPTPEELRERVNELNREMQAAREALRRLDAEMPGQRGPNGRPATTDLDTIVLPENPTRADCEAYIAALETVTQGQNAFSSNDPQVAKLSELPVEHLDLLIAASAGRSPLRYHATYAMRQMDVSVLRERADALLREQPAMIGLIVNQGWSLDARGAISDKLNQRPVNLGLAWFQAAAELRDPALYPAIHDCAVQTRYHTQVLFLLEGMPDYDLERTVSEMWQRATDGNQSNNAHQIATVAIRYGYVDALEVVIEQLTRRSGYYNNNGENTYDTQRATLMRHITFTGTNEEIAQWFAEHKDELVFDHVTQRYLLPGEIESF